MKRVALYTFNSRHQLCFTQLQTDTKYASKSVLKWQIISQTPLLSQFSQDRQKKKSPRQTSSLAILVNTNSFLPGYSFESKGGPKELLKALFWCYNWQNPVLFTKLYYCTFLRASLNFSLSSINFRFLLSNFSSICCSSLSSFFWQQIKKKLKKGTKINETKSTFKKSSFISNLKKVLCVDIVLCRNLDLKT